MVNNGETWWIFMVNMNNIVVVCAIWSLIDDERQEYERK